VSSLNLGLPASPQPLPPRRFTGSRPLHAPIEILLCRGVVSGWRGGGSASGVRGFQRRKRFSCFEELFCVPALGEGPGGCRAATLDFRGVPCDIFLGRKTTPARPFFLMGWRGRPEIAAVVRRVLSRFELTPPGRFGRPGQQVACPRRGS